MNYKILIKKTRVGKCIFQNDQNISIYWLYKLYGNDGVLNLSEHLLNNTEKPSRLCIPTHIPSQQCAIYTSHQPVYRVFMYIQLYLVNMGCMGLISDQYGHTHAILD